MSNKVFNMSKCLIHVAETVRKSEEQVILGVVWGLEVSVVGISNKRGMVFIETFNSVYNQRMLHLNNVWKPEVIVFDDISFNMKVIIEHLWMEGLPVSVYRMTNHNKINTIQKLAIAINSGELPIINNVNLLEQMHKYRYFIDGIGSIKFYPDNSDLIVAAALSWYGIKSMLGGFSISFI